MPKNNPARIRKQRAKQLRHIKKLCAKMQASPVVKSNPDGVKSINLGIRHVPKHHCRFTLNYCMVPQILRR